MYVPAAALCAALIATNVFAELRVVYDDSALLQTRALVGDEYVREELAREARPPRNGTKHAHKSLRRTKKEECRVTLYDDAGYAGQSYDLGLGDHPTGPWNDKITSLKVFGPRCVLRTYVDGEYTGQEAVFGAGEYDLSSLEARGLPNDAVSSLKVEEVECLALMFEHGDFTGRYKAYPCCGTYSMVDDDGGPGNDAISSIQVIGLQETCFVDVYGDAERGEGWSAIFNPGLYDAGAMEARGAVNDDISSFGVVETHTHTCEHQQTPANDDGGGSAIFLDRHDVACDADQMMAGWKMGTPSGNTVSFDYVCCDSLYLRSCSTHETAENDANGGDTRFLDRHTLECPEQEVMSQWKLVHPSDNTIKFEYKCCFVQTNFGNSRTGANCRDAYTAWNEHGEGNVRFLDRHQLQCGQNEGMVKWHLVTSGNEMRFEYMCCRIHVDSTAAPTIEPTPEPTTVEPTPSPTPSPTLPDTVACAWRQTGNCSATGPREPELDKYCNEQIPVDNSGYCDCNGNGVMDGSELGYNCDSTPETCADACPASTTLPPQPTSTTLPPQPTFTTLPPQPTVSDQDLGPVELHISSDTLTENSLGTSSMRFSGVTRDRDVDLVISNATSYTPSNPSANGMSGPNSSFGQINLKCGEQTTFVFAMQDAFSGLPKKLPQFNLTVADLDRGTKGRCTEAVEVETVEDPVAYYVTPSTSLQVSSAGQVIRFTATEKGSDVDNPSTALDGLQGDKAVRLMFTNTQNFTITFFTNADLDAPSDDEDVVGYGGRLILFAGSGL